MLAFLREALAVHPKKTSAVLSLSAAGAAWAALPRCAPLVNAVQAEAQSVLLKHTTRDMACVSPSPPTYPHVLCCAGAGRGEGAAAGRRA